jgi:CRP/FNR family transcriptional regulator, anaerobic regulatory protein
MPILLLVVVDCLPWLPNQGHSMDEASTTRADVAALFRKSDGLLGKLFASLTPESADQLSAHAILRDVPTGTIVLENGQVSSEIGYVIEGMLGMVQVVDQTRWHIVGLLVPTDIYGRLFDGPGSYRLEALSPTKLLVFPRAEFEQVLRAHPEIERMFLVHLLDEIDAAREWLLLISGRTVVNRVASFLIILARRARAC